MTVIPTPTPTPVTQSATDHAVWARHALAQMSQDGANPDQVALIAALVSIAESLAVLAANQTQQPAV